MPALGEGCRRDGETPLLKVAVLVDHRPNHPKEVGGLAGTWERLSSAAVNCRNVDLTVYFLGSGVKIVPKAENVRHVLLPPVLGTHRFPFLQSIPTHTDLSPYHALLFRHLKGFHVLHTTDTFYSFAKTALRSSRARNIPMTTSLQTDMIGWARIHTPVVLRRLIPSDKLVHWLIHESGFLDRRERAMERQMARYLRRCSGVFVSNLKDARKIQTLAPGVQMHFLRRGIRLEQFHPRRRDTSRLRRRFGIPEGRFIVLFVGRVDPVKGPLIGARAVQKVLERGQDIHFLVVGEGSQKGEVQSLLGNRVTVTGNLPHEELGWIYASGDVFIFPSEAEVWPNVVMEAMACGLPIVACREGAAHLFADCADAALFLSGRSPEQWADALESLLRDSRRRERMGQKARKQAERTGVTWNDVLEKDLLPVWRAIAETGLKN